MIPDNRLNPFKSRILDKPRPIPSNVVKLHLVYTYCFVVEYFSLNPKPRSKFVPNKTTKQHESNQSKKPNKT